ncbi:MAG TPA: enoyl-CoA-hydratase DpgB [Micromonosporaceae bacterium]|nr:enoyl-CoA-hydratase DpgB [Micromonosporaceae bacterium]
MPVHITLKIDSGRTLSETLAGDVTAACRQAEDTGAAVVLEVGTAGLDWPGDTSVHLVSRWERALRRLEQVPAPLVAVARGACAGPALEALLVADHRLATGDATFRLGCADDGGWPAMALHRLTTQLGAARTRRLALLGGELTAAVATAWGLVDEVVEPARAGERVAATLDRLSRMPGADLAVLRRITLDAAVTPFEDALGAHLAACDRALRQRQPTP